MPPNLKRVAKLGKGRWRYAKSYSPKEEPYTNNKSNKDTKKEINKMTNYYYQNRLIRRSNRSNYTHALFVKFHGANGVDVIRCLGCSSKYENLLKNYKYYSNRYKGLKSKYDRTPVVVFIDKISSGDA